jgi:hypothetical protein
LDKRLKWQKSYKAVVEPSQVGEGIKKKQTLRCHNGYIDIVDIDD